MIHILAQVLGYLAFIFLAVSLWVNNDIKFRWINSLGSLSFVFYGLLIHAFPIVLTNAVLLAINIYFLFKIYRRQEKFDLIEFKSDAALITKFLSFYQKDIEAYFPGFAIGEGENEIRFAVLRDIVVANLFVATVNANGDAFVKINYTVPKYRDYKVGRFLFDEGKEFLHNKGIKRIIYTQVTNKQHEKFLKVIGFKKESYGSAACYMKYI
ncbi:MAG: YgjV family protein [Chitinophagaceae bacterium]|nr:YgjV family protein [Chitinophagaceae bacterium]MBK8787384.1 YgjV family protein [Chitinophagaceae bacterium]MBK9485886.1 YgjV family protein [Chitinophagaceae bacterium]MBL0201353.1 YgjV family protein [Chitinophagaceae bacterium]